MERKYKESGIKWIGIVPESWQSKRFKYSGIFEKGKLPYSSNIDRIGMPIIGASEMLGKDARTYTSDELVPQCKEDDILILWDGANAGITASGLKGVVSSTAVKYTCLDRCILPKYAAYLLKYAEHYFKEKVNGTTIPHMNMDFINDIPLLCPPLAEQQRIASYLDEKCGEIDSLIGLQEQMIEKLKAYKQSVITEAVTKGLNPNAKLVPSGIDWIGEIPEGWKVTRMKFLGTFQNGLTYTPYDVCGAEGVLVLRSSNIQEAKLTFDDNVFVTKAPEELMVKKGDIIICSRNGSASLVGKCALVEEDILNCSFGAFMVRFRSVISQKFAFYLVSTVIPQYKQLFTTTTINQLTKGMLSSMMGVLPPMDEQQAVASYLDSKCFDIDRLIALKQRKIESLKDYKKSVIYEAVTGKTIIE